MGGTGLCHGTAAGRGFGRQHRPARGATGRGRDPGHGGAGGAGDGIEGEAEGARARLEAHAPARGGGAEQLGEGDAEDALAAERRVGGEGQGAARGGVDRAHQAARLEQHRRAGGAVHQALDGRERAAARIAVGDGPEGALEGHARGLHRDGDGRVVVGERAGDVEHGDDLTVGVAHRDRVAEDAVVAPLVVGPADDAHGAPIMIAAEKAGKTPQQFVADIAAGRKPYLDGFHISFDHWSSTDSAENHELAQSIYRALKAEGLITVRPIEQFFDPEKGMFLADRFIKGECPKCGAKDQYGDSCEVCGAVYAPTELKNPFSALSGATPVLKTSDHHFFKLSDPRCKAFLEQWTHAAGRLQPEVLNKIKECGISPKERTTT